MNITSLFTTNYRNIQRKEMQFSERINVFLGKNAQGKTNLIEALFLIGTLKSIRRADESQLIQFGEQEAKLASLVNKKGIKKEIEIYYYRDKAKRVLVNRKQIYKYADYLGNLNITLFSPDDLIIVKGDASYRRRYLDMLFSQTDKAYLLDLMAYHRILKQRNSVLKDIRSKQRQEHLLDTWDEQICKYANRIVQKRYKNVKFLNEIANKMHKKLIFNENLSIKYIDTIYCGVDENPAEYEKDFILKQKRVRSQEIARGITLLGPHRDDLEIKINGVNTRIFGSQGQKRSVAISLRLGEAEYIQEMYDEYPVLLLDDIFSELDDERKNELLQLLRPEAQIFITGTSLMDFQSMLRHAKVFKIQQGRIEEHHGHEKKRAQTA